MPHYQLASPCCKPAWLLHAVPVSHTLTKIWCPIYMHLYALMSSCLLLCTGSHRQPPHPFHPGRGNVPGRGPGGLPGPPIILNMPGVTMAFSTSMLGPDNMPLGMPSIFMSAPATAIGKQDSSCSRLLMQHTLPPAYASMVVLFVERRAVCVLCVSAWQQPCQTTLQA